VSHNANIPSFQMKSEESDKVLTHEQETQSQQEVPKPSSPKKNGSKFNKNGPKKEQLIISIFFRKV